MITNNIASQFHTGHRVLPHFIKKGPHKQLFVVLAVIILSTACVHLVEQKPGLGAVIAWSEINGWAEDDHAQAWPGLRHNCSRAALSAVWQELCTEIALISEPDNDIARAFFETHFVARELLAENGDEGLITGYYEPLLKGSLTRQDNFRYPIYRRPPDLIKVNLGELYPELNGQPVRGRLVNNEIVPYFSRKDIDNGRARLGGLEIAWVDNAIDVFFLHIQGSGRIRLEDGREIVVGYADQNGHPYESIGGSLIRRGAMEPEQVSMDSIKDWLQQNPVDASDVLYGNSSYIFFEQRDAAKPGPIGSYNVPLTAERSIAVDRRYIELGSPVWLDTTLPIENTPYRRLMLAQDTGGAIKGVVRADVFFGRGQLARERAGMMKQPGRLYVLVPAAR
ncbi:MAG: murein transglycosylase A [Gammaproteobacteria bacterium]|nr:MAG: murein transglycosylase A [Gammaproteobacteria bacterium]